MSKDCVAVTPDGLAPPPRLHNVRSVVAAELAAVDGVWRFDTGAREAWAEVTMTFRAGPAAGPGGGAAFDLRQPIRSACLDGSALGGGDLTPVDLGGGDGAEMRVLAIELTAAGLHHLDLSYPLSTPSAPESRPVEWGVGSVAFDVWCSDLFPARYLEQWLPVGLCQDQFALRLDIEVAKASVEHTIVANGAVTPTGDHAWRIEWPAHHTSLSSLLVIAPTNALDAATTTTSDGTLVEASAPAGTPAAVVADEVARCLEANSRRLGPYTHGRRFVAHVWDHTRGMEYDGATTASMESIPHEVFHSWFGRGVKPSSARDGWIDEAYTSWCTSRVQDAPPLTPRALDLDETPTVLAPASAWSRFTPRAAYRMGYRLFAGLAHLSSTDAVQDAMAQLYRERAGGFVSTDDLGRHLSESLGIDVGPWWDRYVWGRA